MQFFKKAVLYSKTHYLLHGRITEDNLQKKNKTLDAFCKAYHLKSDQKQIPSQIRIRKRCRVKNYSFIKGILIFQHIIPIPTIIKEERDKKGEKVFQRRSLL